MDKISSIRNEYRYAELTEKELEQNPFLQFEKWLNEAIRNHVKEPLAMSVSTIGPDGFPQSRIVLMRNFSKKGCTFFTNYKSQKGKSIVENPRVSLLFFWPELERQVRITGIAKKTPAKESTSYFQSRPFESQVAAIVSKQSTEIPTRAFLEEKFEKLKKSLTGKPAQRPENWGGFLVSPLVFEFWQGRENRLHDRLVYEKTNNNWKVKRLAP